MRFSTTTSLAVILLAGISPARAQQRAQQIDARDQLAVERCATHPSQGPAASPARSDSRPSDSTYVVVVLPSVGRLDPARLAEHQAAVRQRQEAVLARLEPGRFTPVYRYKNFAAMTGYVDTQGLAQLAADPEVFSIEPDARVQATLAESVPFIEADEVQDDYCYTGEGITVAVLDTGIDPNHPDLADDVAPGAWHFLNQGANQGPGALDTNGHGTNVSGIITSAGLIAPSGVAPDADILAVQVLDPNAMGWVSDWIAGVDYVVSVQASYERLAVINMSLGTHDLFEDCPCDNDPNYNQAAQASLQAAKDAGIVTFAASGNDGSSWAMCSPACLSAATAVAAVYDQNYGREPDFGTYGCGCFDPNAYPDLITCFSNRSPCNELAAPGRHIVAPGMGGGTSNYTGTSQATPHASGVAALMLEADPQWQLTPCAIVDILKRTGVPTDDPNMTVPNPRRVDAQAAVDFVLKTPSMQHELSASDGQPGDWFGHSVVIGGDITVVGAREDSDPNADAIGSAYVFRLDQATWTWNEEAKLMASDGQAYDEFGYAVAKHGDTIVVGAPFHEHGGVKSGSAYVFRYDPNDPVEPWPEEAELVPPDGEEGDAFGMSVAITGDYILVGAPYDDDQGSGSGSVYYFYRTGTDWEWRQKLLATDPNDQYTDDRFGISVALTQMMGGPRAVIGADWDDEAANDAGAAYDFDYNILFDSWSQYQKLLASDGESGDCFGFSVSRVGGGIAVGAPYEDDNGQNAGAAYVFGWDIYQYTERAKLLACVGAPSDYFGYSVAVGYDPEPPYGADKVLVGVPMDDDQGDDAGAAYLFQWNDNDTPGDIYDDFWFHRAKIPDAGGQPGDHFGYAVALACETAVISALDHDCGGGPNSGCAWIFEPGFEDCNNNGYPDDCDIDNGTSPDSDANGTPDECECDALGQARGDTNGDGSINGLDIDPFVDALVNPPQFNAVYAPLLWQCTADINCDGSINGLDIDPFVQCLTSACPDCPE